MNGRAIPGAYYLFRLYVCDKEMSWPHHIGETHQPDWVVYVRDTEKWGAWYHKLLRLTNVIPERIIFVSRRITVFEFCPLADRTCHEGSDWKAVIYTRIHTRVCACIQTYTHCDIHSGLIKKIALKCSTWINVVNLLRWFGRTWRSQLQLPESLE